MFIDNNELSPHNLKVWRSMACDLLKNYDYYEWTAEMTGFCYNIMPNVILSYNDVVIINDNEEPSFYGIQDKLTALYILQCQPKNIIALIDEVNFLRKENEILKTKQQQIKNIL